MNLNTNVPPTRLTSHSLAAPIPDRFGLDGVTRTIFTVKRKGGVVFTHVQL